MRVAFLLFVYLLLGTVPGKVNAEDVTTATLERFLGVWHMDLATHEETFGDSSGPGQGTMTCSWGAMKAWMDCDMESVYEGIGPYALKIVLHRTARDGTVGAFVTNSFGGGRLYVGQGQDNNRLVFRDAWIDPSRKWNHQLTTYTFSPPDTIKYMIEVSTDKVNYYPHSSGVYTRKSSLLSGDRPALNSTSQQPVHKGVRTEEAE